MQCDIKTRQAVLAGIGGDKNCCVPVAMSYACDIPLKTALKLCEDAGRKRGCGMFPRVWLPLFSLCADVEKVELPSWVKTSASLKRWAPLQRGRYIVLYRGHLGAYVDGKTNDWINGSRHRVYHVWRITNTTWEG